MGKISHLADPHYRPPSVGIVGGGLAGMAAAVALRSAGLPVEIFEWRRRLGGRATSFRDPQTDELVDHCQHVSMGCCTNLADFCRRTGIHGLFRRDRRLHFFGPDGSQCDFEASRLLPAPLHLWPALRSLTYLSRHEQRQIMQSLYQMAKWRPGKVPEPTVGDWLRQQGVSDRVIELFWAPIVVSALSESVDVAGLSYARQVFVQGFMSSRRGYEIEVPLVPLAELYGQHLVAAIAALGAQVHTGAGVQHLDGDQHGVLALVLASGERRNFDFVLLAVPWQRVSKLLPIGMLKLLPQVAALGHLQPSPITAVHLWFDRPITELPHAVLVGRLSQWVFRRGTAPLRDTPAAHYYQVVISASRDLLGGDREQIVRQVCDELQSVWPRARSAQLLKWRMVTEPAAVFSVRPGSDRFRPPQSTPIPHLFLAGDWTATGWPATMEGAVRSGYLAAEGILRACRRPQKFVVPDLPRGLLARWW